MWLGGNEGRAGGMGKDGNQDSEEGSRWFGGGVGTVGFCLLLLCSVCISIFFLHGGVFPRRYGPLEA